VATILHTPQVTADPFHYKGSLKRGSYRVFTIDRAGNRAGSEALEV
jgi:hypothetical protein